MVAIPLDWLGSIADKSWHILLCARGVEFRILILFIDSYTQENTVREPKDQLHEAI